MTQQLRLCCLTLSAALTALAASAETPKMEIQLSLVVDGDQVVGMSYSTASGPFVATAELATPAGVATGAIASVDPVTSIETEGVGFGLFSSPVGTHLPE
ncbi:hypothetical protein [Histidinibacterium lentulum]|uniref:Uncharacterized protein n=1 Tax=Histidinibacterium lentulum TaxID=2480588 RepID=A0A3N2R8V0_9RHOB|nr:hypothetical protein [Histidinibacterium lentulum]ROU03900.1 hypothetical protein EAT49_00365 [Histidinibacterium lentulum]